MPYILIPEQICVCFTASVFVDSKTKLRSFAKSVHPKVNLHTRMKAKCVTLKKQVMIAFRVYDIGKYRKQIFAPCSSSSEICKFPLSELFFQYSSAGSSVSANFDRSVMKELDYILFSLIEFSASAYRLLSIIESKIAKAEVVG